VGAETFTLVACDALIAELRGVASRPLFQGKTSEQRGRAGVAAGLRDFSFLCNNLPSGPAAS